MDIGPHQHCERSLCRRRWFHILDVERAHGPARHRLGVIFELIEDLAKLALIVASLYFALGAYVRRTRPAWSEPLERRRLMLLSVLVLAVCAIKVSEEAIGGGLGPIDQAILLFIHRHGPATPTGFFGAGTPTRASQGPFSL